MIKTILWDMDDTLLDFPAAESAALKSLFVQFGLPECTDDMIARYSNINRSYWERLERGEITKQEVLIGRYREFFCGEGIDISIVEQFNEAYQLKLGDTIVFLDDSKTIVEDLKGRYAQYIVSNGTVIAQTKKLQRSGFDQLMDGVFLSEEVGYEKPAREFFDKVLEEIPKTDKKEIMIVGDSLTSDMLGGKRAGIVTCWYNKKKTVNHTGLCPDYEIENLKEIYKILDES